IAWVEGVSRTERSTARACRSAYSRTPANALFFPRFSGPMASVPTLPPVQPFHFIIRECSPAVRPEVARQKLRRSQGGAGEGERLFFLPAEGECGLPSGEPRGRFAAQKSNSARRKKP